MNWKKCQGLFCFILFYWFILNQSSIYGVYYFQTRMQIHLPTCLQSNTGRNLFMLWLNRTNTFTIYTSLKKKNEKYQLNVFCKRYQNSDYVRMDIVTHSLQASVFEFKPWDENANFQNRLAMKMRKWVQNHRFKHVLTRVNLVWKVLNSLFMVLIFSQLNIHMFANNSSSISSSSCRTISTDILDSLFPPLPIVYWR